MKIDRNLLKIEAWNWRVGRRIRPWIRPNWPNCYPSTVDKRLRIAIVTVNYNTKALLSRLVFSLRRIVDERVSIAAIVVVDNNSTDGSVELIEQLAAARIVEPILNKRQRYHGPGLNQGMKLLRERVESADLGFKNIDYVFVVDSDVIICRGEIFFDSIKAMELMACGMAGEFEANEYIPGGYAHVSSLLFKPCLVWRRGFHPFEEHGVPALEFQRSLVRRRLLRLNFPYRKGFYVVHLWSGTLRAICHANERHNKYYDWASVDLPTRPSIDQETNYIQEEFEQVFRREVSDEMRDSLVVACLKNERLHLWRPYEISSAPSFVPGNCALRDGYVVG